jgi:hypothetical protein
MIHYNFIIVIFDQQNAFSGFISFKPKSILIKLVIEYLFTNTQYFDGILLNILKVYILKGNLNNN